MNGQSIIRPNQGGYYITNEYLSKQSTPCESKGIGLAMRIGHYISHRVVVKGKSNHIQSRTYTIEKGGEVYTGTISELTKKQLKGINQQAIWKAVRKNTKVKGWDIRLET